MLNKILVVLIVLVILLIWLLYFLSKKLREERWSKRSLAVKYGKKSEQFMPFLNDYPYDADRFRFIGNPIDGIQFEEDKIIFVEFKTGDALLNQNQKRIKEIVDKKRVEFKEFKI